MKIKRVIISILLLVFSFSFVHAQSSAGGGSRRPATFTLTVNSNVSAVQIKVDGAPIKGNSISVKPGNHTVQVSANGYFDWQQTVNVTANQTVMATLQPLVYNLTVDGNVKGARVFINGNPQGMISYSQDLRPGQYTIKVAEFGYQEWETTINLTGNQKVYAELQPALASVQVSLPSSVLNSRDKGAAGKVEIYVDGRRQGTSFQLPPGQHEVEILSGGLGVKQTITVQPGASYTIEPAMGINLR